MKSVTIKKAGIALGLGLVALLGVAREAQAQDEELGPRRGDSALGEYLFRGLDLLAGEPWTAGSRLLQHPWLRRLLVRLQG